MATHICSVSVGESVRRRRPVTAPVKRYLIIRVPINQRCETRANVSVSWEYRLGNNRIPLLFSLFLSVSLSKGRFECVCARLNCAPDKRAVRKFSTRRPRDIVAVPCLYKTRVHACIYTRMHECRYRVDHCLRDLLFDRWRNPREIRTPRVSGRDRYWFNVSKKFNSQVIIWINFRGFVIFYSKIVTKFLIFISYINFYTWQSSNEIFGATDIYSFGALSRVNIRRWKQRMTLSNYSYRSLIP